MPENAHWASVKARENEDASVLHERSTKTEASSARVVASRPISRASKPAVKSRNAQLAGREEIIPVPRVPDDSPQQRAAFPPPLLPLSSPTPGMPLPPLPALPFTFTRAPDNIPLNLYTWMARSGIKRYVLHSFRIGRWESKTTFPFFPAVVYIYFRKFAWPSWFPNWEDLRSALVLQ